MTSVKVSKTNTAKLPYRATDGSACYDIYSDEDVTLIPFVPVKVSTGLSFELPNGKMMEILPRSSSVFKRRLIHHGIIDSDYRGVVSVVVTPLWFGKIVAGESIAQCRVLDIGDELVYNVVSANELSETSRGDGGFGSTG